MTTHDDTDDTTRTEAPDETPTPRETEIAMAVRLWDLGIGIDEIAAALQCSPRVAAGIVHHQLCAWQTPHEAARDARLCGWWQSLTGAARSVQNGLRTASDVATEYGTTSDTVRVIIAGFRRHGTPGNRRGTGLRTPVLGRLYTAWEYGIPPADVARMVPGVRISTIRLYHARLRRMTPQEQRDEAERVEADRWVYTGREIVSKEDMKNG